MNAGFQKAVLHADCVLEPAYALKSIREHVKSVFIAGVRVEKDGPGYATQSIPLIAARRP